MTDEEIDSVESKYGITFSFKYRAFLKILHSIDRKEVIEYTETFDKDEEAEGSQKTFTPFEKNKDNKV